LILTFATQFQFLNFRGPPDFASGPRCLLKNGFIELGSVQLKCRKPSLMLRPQLSTTRKIVVTPLIEPHPKTGLGDLLVAEVVGDIQDPHQETGTDFTSRFADLSIELGRLFNDEDVQRRILALEQVSR
jgi:hypothetical protein